MRLRACRVRVRKRARRDRRICLRHVRAHRQHATRGNFGVGDGSMTAVLSDFVDASFAGMPPMDLFLSEGGGLVGMASASKGAKRARGLVRVWCSCRKTVKALKLASSGSGEISHAAELFPRVGESSRSPARSACSSHQ